MVAMWRWTGAFVGPGLVGLLAFWLVSGAQNDDDRRALENAGRVVNGVVVDVGSPVAIDRWLARDEPEVIVLGPSYANTDIRPLLLGRRLGIARDDLAMLSVPNSVGAHWYAVLRHRVFDAGHRPKAIVIVSGLQSMLLTTPLTEASWLNLAVHLPDGQPDAVIDAKVRWDPRLWVARLREQRGILREQWFGRIRYAVLPFWFESPRRPGQPITQDEARFALGQVFDDARVDMSLHVSGMPVAVVGDPTERFYDPGLLGAPSDTFLSDITELARAHGAEMLWVRPPMSPHIPKHLDDRVGPGVQEAAMEVIEAAGGHYLDMRALPMTAAMFKNEDHMNEEGSRRFTEALARAIQELGLLADGPVLQDNGRLVAELFEVGRVDGGVMVDASVRPDYPKPPGEVPGADRAWVDAPAGMAKMDTSRWAFLSDEHLIGETHFGSRCSPLRVLEDAVPLPLPNVPCVDVKNQGHGRSCHMPEALFFSASDGTDPMENGRTYTLVLDDRRVCDGAAWLYPTDRFTVAWPVDRLDRLEEGADTFTLGGRYLQNRKVSLRVRLTVGGEVQVDEVIDGRRFKAGPVRWTLDPPIPRGLRDVVLEIENQDYVFYLIETAALSSEGV